MTETVEQTRRALFEAWMKSNLPQVKFSTIHHMYIPQAINSMWAGFNAALDAVEIELPKLADQPVADHYCWSACEEKCRSAIQSLNLGLRIK